MPEGVQGEKSNDPCLFFYLQNIFHKDHTHCIPCTCIYNKGNSDGYMHHKSHPCVELLNDCDGLLYLTTKRRHSGQKVKVAAIKSLVVWA